MDYNIMKAVFVLMLLKRLLITLSSTNLSISRETGLKSKNTYLLIILLWVFTPSSAFAANVEITVDWPTWGSENRVVLKNSSGTTLASICDPSNCFNSLGNAGYTQTYTYTLADNANFTLEVEDAYGDGWGGGNVTVRVNGSQVLSDDGPATSFESLSFSTSASTPTSSTVIPAPSCVAAASGETFYGIGFTSISPASTLTTNYRLTTNGVVNGQPIDVLVTLGATPNNTSGSWPFPMINGDDFRIVQKDVPLVVTYTFVNTGTNTPVTGNFRVRIGDLDMDERLQVNTSGIDSFIFNNPTNLSASESGGTLTIVSGSAGNHYIPEDTTEFVLIGRSSFQVTYDPSLAPSDQIFDFDMDVDTTLSTLNCQTTPASTASKDYSDAPAVYGSASHDIDASYRLGANITSESSAVQNADNASDDGITVTSMTQGTEAYLTAQVTGSGGYLNAWFDWNGDGDFADDGEQLLSNSSDGDLSDRNSSAGVIVQKISIPSYAASNVYARFRWSTEPVFPNDITETTKNKPDGEVEDYLFSVATGNAAPTGTQVCTNKTGAWTGSGGNWSATAGSLTVGATFTAAAGASFTGTSASTMNTINAWSDSTVRGASALSFVYNWDTSPENPGLPASNDAATGVMSLSFNQPVTNPVIHIDRIGGTGYSSPGSAFISPTTSGAAYTKLTGTPHFIVWSDRLHREVVGTAAPSEESSMTPSAGTAAGSVAISGTYSSLNFSMIGGGVEGTGGDLMKIVVCATPAPTASADYGDAPASYGSPSHTIVAGMHIGSTAPDGEASTQSNSAATGDDATGTDDEDGVSIPTLVQGQAASLTLDVTGSTGYLQGWIDWNQDGDFLDTGEQVITNVYDGSSGDESTTSGVIEVSTTVPSGAVTGSTYARFRWSNNPNLSANTGVATNGEIEDYAVTVSAASSPSFPSIGTCVNDDTIWYNTQTQLRTYNVSTGVDALQRTLARAYGDIAWSPNGKLYGIEFIPGISSGVPGSRVPGYRIYELSPTGSTESLVVSGNEFDSVNSLAADSMGWLYFGSGHNYPSNPSYGGWNAANSRVYRVNPGLASVELWMDFGAYGYTNGHPSGDYVFMDGYAYVGWTPTETSSGSSTSALLKVGPLDANNKPTASTTVVSLGASVPDVFGLTGNINGTLYGVSGSTSGLYTFTTSSYSATFVATLGGAPWGATQKSEGAGTVCAPAPDLDYSDSPAAYGVATHTVVSGVQLGTAITDESSAVQDADNASDDGVDLSGLVRGSPKLITVHVPFSNGTDYLQAWVDWNGDGDFLDVGEQVATDLRDDGNGVDGTFNDGQIQVMLNVPAGAAASTWARFRYSSDAGLASTGTASDGEVEDYLITNSNPVASVPIDPQACTGGNLLTNGDFNSGSTSWLESHRTDTSNSGPMTIGLVGVNSSLTGAPWIGPNGAGVARSYVDNDGNLGDTYVNLRNETVLSLTNGETYNFGFDIQEIPNPASQSALIGWALVDATTGAIVQQIPGVSVELDGTDKTGSYPLVTTSWQTFSQRFTTTVPTGNYKLAMTFDAYLDSSIAMIDFYMDKVYFAPETVCDYSDAPADGDAAPTSGTTAYGATRHAQVAGFYLGASVTDESGAVTDADNASDDGIASFTLDAGATADVTIPASDITGAGVGTLHAWIDFDGDGTFATGEYASVGFNNGASGPLTFSSYGTTMATGTTYARFRLTPLSDALTAADFARAATAGEVEDYAVTVGASNTFTCDATLYQVSNTPSILRSAKFSGSSATFNDIGTAPRGLNGTWGYNTLDNYIYGIDAGTKDLWRVGTDGVFLKIATVSGLADVVNNAGGISDSGELFAKLATSNNHWAVVDLADPAFPVLRTFTLSGAAANKIFFDVVWNPIDDMIYGVATDTSIIKVDTTTGVGTIVVPASGNPILNNIAGLWLTASNTLIGYSNSHNAYYSIDMITGQTTKLADSVSSGGATDGAGCRGPAPISTGTLSGVVYDDDDQSNLQNGAEAGIPNITVTLYFDNGTPADLSDDTVVGSRTTAADGSYSFTGVNASGGVSYRAEVDTADADLSVARTIGTTNPLAGLTVTVGGTTTADFGFDQSMDFSDGASGYGDATHLIVTGIQIGATVTAESVAIEGADNASDDGIDTLRPLHDQDRTYSVDVITTNQAVNPARLIAWIDFDGNGSFDADEAAMRIIASGTMDGATTLKWSSIPLDIQAGNTFLRLRLSTESISNQESGGAKSDGEVEDYPITITTTGVTLSGRVFQDINVSAVSDSGELGVTQLPVVLYNTGNGSCVSTRTDGNGSYRFEGVAPGKYQVYKASRERVPTPRSCGPSFAKDPSGYRSTTQSVLDAFDVVSHNISNLDFGNVKPPVFEPNNTGQVLPGNVLFYAHRFRTPTNGSVRFASTSSGNVSSGWTSLIYRDSDCNGRLDGTEAQFAMMGTHSSSTTWVSDAIGVVAEDQARDSVCLINKVYAPANVVANDGFLQTITANFDYNNNAIAGSQALIVKDFSTAKQVQAPALPATPEVTAVPAIAAQPEQLATPNTLATETTAALPGTPYIPAIDGVPAQVSVAATPVLPEVGSSRLELRKTVQNITQAGSPETETINKATPGDTLKYRIYYRNTGSGPLTELKVNDIVPPYTSLELLSNVCHDTPAGMTCAPVISGDDLRWDFTGSLLGGASGWVSYSVVVDD